MKKYKNMQFPAPTGPYKANPKNSVPWKNHNLARIQISVGKPNSEGDKFFATTEWANHRFKTVQLIVSDTLQRWNLVFEDNLNMEQAWQQSAEMGEQWLKRNAQAISLIEKPEVIRWDDCISDPEWQNAKETLEQETIRNQDFEQALTATINAFWHRNKNSQKMNYQNYAHFFEISKSFLIEELAVFTFLCKPNGIDIYAGSWMSYIFKALSQCNNDLYKVFNNDWLQIDFTRNKNHAYFIKKAA